MSEAYNFYQQGRRHLADGMAAQATVALEKAKRREPRKASIRESLGIAYFRIRRFDEAEQEFRAVLELSPVNDYAHYALGRCLEKQGAARRPGATTSSPARCGRKGTSTSTPCRRSARLGRDEPDMGPARRPRAHDRRACGRNGARSRSPASSRASRRRSCSPATGTKAEARTSPTTRPTMTPSRSWTLRVAHARGAVDARSRPWRCSRAATRVGGLDGLPALGVRERRARPRAAPGRHLVGRGARPAVPARALRRLDARRPARLARGRPYARVQARPDERVERAHGRLAATGPFAASTSRPTTSARPSTSRPTPSSTAPASSSSRTR